MFIALKADMELNLKRPLVVFDVETTGLNVITDRIIELSYVKVYPDGHEEEKTFRFNPEMPIPDKSMAVHHITDDDVKDCPRFADMAEEIAQIFRGCDLAGFNSNHFDIPVLAQHFSWSKVDFDFNECRFVDVQNIFHKMEKRDLAAACRFYCGEEMENHHSSLADAQTTLRVLKAQLDRYAGNEQIKKDVEALAKFSQYDNKVDLAGRVIYETRPDGEKVMVINFGKYKGQPLEEVLAQDHGYAGWVISKDFAEDTKRVFREAAARVKEKLAKAEPSDASLQALADKFNTKH